MHQFERQFTHGDREDLNLPVQLLKDTRSSKIGKELVALSIAIKCNYPDSRMPNVSPTAIQKLLRCGFNKAKQLLSEAKLHDSLLFTYNPKTNSLLAHNLTRRYYSLSTSSRGTTIKSAHCYKLPIKNDYTLKELKETFNRILMKYSIWAKEQKEGKGAKDALRFKNKTKKSSFIRTSPLSQYSIQKAIGFSNRKAVQRLTKKMEKDGELNVNRHGLHFAGFYAYQTEEMKKRFNPKTMMILKDDGAVCYKQYNEYKMEDEEMNRFKHVIFNHSFRIHSRHVKPETEESSNKKRTLEEILAMYDEHDSATRKYA